MHGLSDQQRRFADFLLAGCSQSEAYQKAGYTARGNSAESKASRLVRNGKVAAYLDKQRKKAEQSTGVTVVMVIEGLLTEARFSGDGARHSARITAWELLGKTLGMFFDNPQKEGEPTEKPNRTYNSTDMSSRTTD